MWWLVVLGVAASWKKSRGGVCHTWVGYELSLRDWTLRVSAPRAGWIRSWYERTLKTREVDTGELREALGRIQFVYGALVYDRPFLHPSTHSWLSTRQVL